MPNNKARGWVLVDFMLWFCLGLTSSGEGDLKDRLKESKVDKANHAADKEEDNGFDQGAHSGHPRLEFAFVEFGHMIQRLGKLAGLFPDGDHLFDEWGEIILVKAVGKGLSPKNIVHRKRKTILVTGVLRRCRGDLKGLRNG